MDPRMMNAWLQAQAQKQELTTTAMQQKRLGIVPDTYGTSNLKENNNELLDLAKKRADSGLKIINDINPKLTYPSNNNFSSFSSSQIIGNERMKSNTEDVRAEISKRTPQPKPGLLGALGLNEQGLALGKTIQEPYKDSGKLAKPGQVWSKNKTIGEDGNLTPRNPRQGKTPKSVNEQLNSEEEAYARKHKHMLSSMIDQYGEEKGTKVFYATVRNKVRGK